MREVLKRLFGEEFKTLVILNLMVAALCLPVLTIGPALLALNGTLIKILDDRCDLDRIREFRGLFRKKFWKGIAFELLFAGYAVMLLMSQTLGLALGDSGQVVLVLALIMGAMAAMVSVCLCLILASVQMPFFEALWNSVLLALGRFPRVALSTLCVYGVVYAGILLYPDSLVFLAVLMIAVPAAVSLAFMWKPLNDLVFASCQEEEENNMGGYRL